jgi:hypothetical protein
VQARKIKELEHNLESYDKELSTVTHSNNECQLRLEANIKRWEDERSHLKGELEDLLRTNAQLLDSLNAKQNGVAVQIQDVDSSAYRLALQSERVEVEPDSEVEIESNISHESETHESETQVPLPSLKTELEGLVLDSDQTIEDGLYEPDPCSQSTSETDNQTQKHTSTSLTLAHRKRRAPSNSDCDEQYIYGHYGNVKVDRKNKKHKRNSPRKAEPSNSPRKCAKELVARRRASAIKYSGGRNRESGRKQKKEKRIQLKQYRYREENSVAHAETLINKVAVPETENEKSTSQVETIDNREEAILEVSEEMVAPIIPNTVSHPLLSPTTASDQDDHQGSYHCDTPVDRSHHDNDSLPVKRNRARGTTNKGLRKEEAQTECRKRTTRDEASLKGTHDRHEGMTLAC